MIQLETYRGTKTRHTCPACSCQHCFVRYVGDGGEYISFDVGRCNRESKCGYHKKPKEYFAENPTSPKFQPATTGKRNSFPQTSNRKIEVKTQNPQFDFIKPEHLKPTFGNYERNAFVQFLLNLFPDCGNKVRRVLEQYFVGTYEDYTCFPSVEQPAVIRRAKLIRFDRMTGKRLQGQFDTSSLPAKLKLKDFQYKQIFFGEHLLPKYPDKPVAIVEAEKTAIVASLYFPGFVWLATGSKQWLKTERLQRLDKRQIILYPDADGFNLWREIAADARKQGLNVKVSSLIEKHATARQREKGFDLADYLISNQAEVNQYNSFVESYNAKTENILNDEKLMRDFETILAEQMAIAVIDGGLSESEAETRVSSIENLRQIALSV